MPNPGPVLIVTAFLLFAYVRSILDWRRRSRGRPLPPGPGALPIVGNLYNAPNFKPWEGYRDLCDEYGDIVHLRFFNRHVVVLGSPEVIFEFLDKRSVNTSDRDQTPLVELTGSNINFAFMPYSQWWRRHRRVFWQYFHPGAIGQYQPVQRETAHRFLLKLLRDPDNFVEHIRYTFTAAMTKILYDSDGDEDVRQHMIMIEQAQEGVAQGMLPGRFLVESFPLLRHIPQWVPGASLTRLSKEWIAAAMHLKETPFTRYKQSTGATSTGRSIIGQMLIRLSEEETKDVDIEEEEDLIKNIGTVSSEGTTYSTMQALFLAMSLNPEVLKKAHDELDVVVGPGRLPDFSDHEQLVYVNAIIREVMRWHTVLPLCVPHCTTSDDELHGHFIPAGTVLLPNTWACMHDPEVFEAPHEFRPERFIRDGRLDVTLQDPTRYMFGYGRRICPGRHFAEDILFINIASVLHVFDIGPPLDGSGKPIAIVPDTTDGLLSYPADCRCSVKPRSSHAERLIVNEGTRKQ
ncbi:cytochrome P450 [Cerioporus squamosus]|nr:cytochrome P450 [Cerioporus squamosus]